MLDLVFQPENKAVRYDLKALLEQRYDLNAPQPKGWTAPHVTLWQADLGGAVPVASLPMVQADPALKRAWLG